MMRYGLRTNIARAEVRRYLHFRRAGSSMKLWNRRDEWTQYANCHNSIDHTLPPERGEEDADKPVADAEHVQRICGACRVRPECIEYALGKDQPYPPTEVWAAGRFIPVDKRKARRVRQELAASLADERAARGDDV